MDPAFNRWTRYSVASRVTLASLLASCAITGCAPAAPPSLPQQAELLAEGTPAALTASPPRVTVSPGAMLLVLADQFDTDVALELRDDRGEVVATSAGPAGPRGRELLVWQAPTAADGAESAAELRIHVRAVGPDRPPSGRVRLAWVEVAASAPEVMQAALALTAKAMAAAPSTDAARRAADFEALERRWLDVGERELAAQAALQLAALRYVELEQWDAAVDAATRAEAALRALGAAKDANDAALLRGVATSEQRRARGEPDKAALATILDARRQYQALSLPVAAAEALNFAGMAQFYRSDIAAAVGSFEAAAEEFGRAAAVEPRRKVLQNLAAVQFDRGEYRQAARAYEELLTGWPDADPGSLAVALQNAAFAVSYIGEYERALGWFLQSLDAAERAGSTGLEARARQGLGDVHLQLGQPSVAGPHFRAAIRLFAGSNERVPQTLAQNGLGDALRAQGDLSAAVREQRAALAALGASSPPAVRARVLASLGLSEAAQGRHRAAERLFGEVLSLNLPATTSAVLRARYGRARSWVSLGRRQEAMAELDGLVTVARAEFLTDQEVLLRGLRAQLRRDAGDRAGALDDTERALVALERLTEGTANPDNRVTLATQVRDLFDLRVDLLASGGDAFAALQVLERHGARGNLPALQSAGPAIAGASEALEEALALRRYRLEELTERAGTDQARIDALQAEIAVLRSRIAQQIDGLAARPAPLLDQGKLVEALPEDATLLVYSLGRERGWLWQLSHDRFELHRLAAAPVIDQAISQLLSSIRQFRDPEQQLRRLQRLLLPMDLTQFEGKRLFIVPDGSLTALPWALMKRRANAAAVQQLARVADVQRGPLARAPATSRQWTAALFGDARFGRDPRGFAPLPGTRRELDVIRARIGGDTVQVFSGLAASREALLALPTGELDILHVATHAYLDAHVPELSALVLSQVDASGTSVVGDVRPRDLLRWPRAPRLVVLSACDAAAEPSRQAPGLLSLTRALQARGTEHVVASLWPVADAAAVALMDAFYRALIEDKLPPDRALTAAQRQLEQSPQWRAPFFWAGFVVIGGTGT